MYKKNNSKQFFITKNKDSQNIIKIESILNSNLSKIFKIKELQKLKSKQTHTIKMV